MDDVKLIGPGSASWESHPRWPGVQFAYLLSHAGDGAEITCALVRLAAGAEPEKHVHEESDDILYVLKGRAKMWVEGVGDIPLVAGTFLRIPKGTPHQPYAITEDLVIYDVWSPHVV